MATFMIDPSRISSFPDSFLEYFLTQEDVSEVTKVLIREVIAQRKNQKDKSRVT